VFEYSEVFWAITTLVELLNVRFKTGYIFFHNELGCMYCPRSPERQERVSFHSSVAELVQKVGMKLQVPKI
jgi:hypothetical protein